MSELRFIVEKLNEAPFSQKLTLVTLDEKNPIQLLQVVNDVFTQLDSVHLRDLRDEPSEQTAQRMLGFLAALNYKHGMDPTVFRDAFCAADKSVIYPLLYWILSRVPELSKRAYLARFLKTIEIPEEFFNDENLVEMYHQYKQMQDEFKEAHKEVEKQRQSKVDPAAFQKELDQLESEREQLRAKLGKLQARVRTETDAANFQEILAATSALRKEQEDEHALMEQFREQEHQLMTAAQRMQQAQRQLNDIHANSDQTDPHQMLMKIRDEVKTQHYILEQKLGPELDDKEARLNELEQQLQSEPMSDEMLQEMQGDIRLMQNRIEELTEQQQRMISSADSKLSFYRKPAQGVAKKKEAIQATLNEKEEEKDELESQLRELDRELQAANGGKQMKTEAEVKAYMKEVAARATTCKNQKGMLQDLRNEIAVLERTEALLKSRDSNLKEYLEDLERKKGIEGYSATQDRLEDVASNKQRVDQRKEATLEEISRLVMDISNQLNAKKNKLAPQIKDLRTARQSFMELETTHAEKKKAFEHTALGLDSERAKLEQEVHALTAGVLQEESRFHYLNSHSQIKQAQLDKVIAETQYLSGQRRLSQEFRSHTEQLEKFIASQETRLKQLRQKQSALKTSHTDSVQQRELYHALRSLMEVKLRSVQEQARQSANDQQEHNFMSVDQGF